MNPILLAAVAYMAGFAPAAAEDDPVALVKDLLRLEMWMISASDPGEDQPFSDSALVRFYTPALTGAYLAVMERQRVRNEPMLNGDPITGRQEYCPLRDIAVGLAAPPTADAATVIASFRSQWCYPEAGEAVAGEVTDLAFVLVQVDGGWRIDDFVDSRQGSLRELLATLMRE